MDLRYKCALIIIFMIGTAMPIRYIPRYGNSHQKAANNDFNHVNYKTKYYIQQVDHMSYVNNDLYKQRYLIADQYWDRDTGPIFFYTGNEGDITWFCNNTGLMWDWAPQFKALLIFAEHRYYGESMPYGKESFTDLTRAGYLSSEQALADFATLISHIKITLPGAYNKPVIAFGGSYGGMLSAWFRMKYPHIVSGALAASAPIWLFGDLVPCEAFYKTVTKDFIRESPQCADNIAQSWKLIQTTAQTVSGREELKETFHLCSSLGTSDISVFLDWLQETYVNLAMVDYPYAASFLEPLPAWPIKAVCSYLSTPEMSSSQLLHAISQGVRLYYNYTGTTQCLDIKQQATPDLGDLGWGFQACTEMVMPLCSDGKNDMFLPSPWQLEKYIAECKLTWGVTPRPDWIIQQYGGRNITTATNIIFSNGDLDPWSAGGVRSSLSQSMVAIRISDGAHHLDLRASTPDDTPSVIKARQQEHDIITGWIHQYWAQQNPAHSSWDWPTLYLYKSSIFGQDSVDQSPNQSSDGDLTMLFAMSVFMMLGLLLLCYLGLVQSIARYLDRQPSERTHLVKTNVPCDVDYTPLILDDDDDDDDDELLILDKC